MVSGKQVRMCECGLPLNREGKCDDCDYSHDSYEEREDDRSLGDVMCYDYELPPGVI